MYLELLFHLIFFFDRPKHPLKVHVWAGISKRGSTGICIFDGIMVKEPNVNILDKTLVPFIRAVYPEGHRFMADNDPKHTSRYAQDYLESNGVYWWRQGHSKRYGCYGF